MKPAAAVILGKGSALRPNWPEKYQDSVYRDIDGTCSFPGTDSSGGWAVGNARHLLCQMAISHCDFASGVGVSLTTESPAL